MALAFKEWSYIVDALGKGKQSIIIRKGGISEEKGEFEVKGNKFFLFPTLFHQAESMIKEDWLKELDGGKFHTPDNTARIEYYAEIADTRLIKDYSILEKLYQQHAWKEEIIKERFNRWEKSAHLLILQIYKLHSPFELELLPEYAGCKSWIHINNKGDFSGIPVINEMLRGKF